MSQRYSAVTNVYNELARKNRFMNEEFRRLDTDRDSYLSQSEFRHLLSNCNIHMNENDLQYFFNLNSENGRVSFAKLNNEIREHANSSLSQSANFLEPSSSEYGMEGGTRLMTLGQINIPKNYDMNAYTHIRRQDISRLDDTFDDSQSLPTSVFRTGHVYRSAQRRNDTPEVDSQSPNLSNYSFRTNVQLIHKNMIISSSVPVHDNTIQTVSTSIQQELIQSASLRYSSFSQINDTANNYRYSLMMVWMPNSPTNAVVESIFGKDQWKRLCNKYFSHYGLNVEWMIDIHPDYCDNRIFVYLFLCLTNMNEVLINTRFTSHYEYDEPAAYLSA